MKRFPLALTPQQIASRLDGQLILRKSCKLDNVSELVSANKRSICVYEQPKYLDALKQCPAGLIFVPQNFDINIMPEANLIRIQHPYLKFMMVVKTWLELTAPKAKSSVHKSAVVPPSATIGKNVRLDANVVLGENVTVGDGSVIMANCVLGDNVQIGQNCRLHPGVTVYEDCILENRVILHSGSVIGADGFGYLYFEGEQKKVPQVGNVILQDDVEVGANSTIDRSTLGSTIIGKGTKIDNLVQVGHNCEIGEHSILCAQVGLAGSTTVGNVVYIAGQVGVAGHLKIEDGARIGAQSGITNTVPKGARYFGTPATDATAYKRMLVAQRKVPELLKTVKELQKQHEERE
ncbi:MAG: UDP-3-O-(3-hydroxymyristoyl)glucosamine N-acyltransferase [Candidatus Cloacimonetes bacterium]|nr:UDP-3-O-(3-hydroxymyristoyl)glucosamine N-acyltransferase [Candidatus Cloacimonadota bacterium]